MDWLQFWSSIVSSLAWPVCAVLISLVFRKKLGELLAKITKLELPGGISTEFDRGLANVEQAAVAAVVSYTEASETHNVNATVDPLSANNDREVSAVSGRGERTTTHQDSAQLEPSDPKIADPVLQSSIFSNWWNSIEEADVHPTGVVMESWKELESTIFRIASTSLASGKILKFNIGDILTTVRRLTDAGVLSKAEATALQELRRLRNLAAHSTDPLNPSDARKFARQARSLKDALAARIEAV